MELSGQLIREGANGNPISRNPGGKLSQQQCIGGILFTAELLFGKASDVERCILIPITRQLHLPNQLYAGTIWKCGARFLVYVCQPGG